MRVVQRCSTHCTVATALPSTSARPSSARVMRGSQPQRGFTQVSAVSRYSLAIPAVHCSSQHVVWYSTDEQSASLLHALRASTYASFNTQICACACPESADPESGNSELAVSASRSSGGMRKRFSCGSAHACKAIARTQLMAARPEPEALSPQNVVMFNPDLELAACTRTRRTAVAHDKLNSGHSLLACPRDDCQRECCTRDG